MDARKGLFISGALFICLIIIGFFIRVEVFTRAEGEIISFTPPVYSDFADEGLLKNIYVSEGDSVEKGQIIAELNNEELKINLDIFLDKKRKVEGKLGILNSLLEEQTETKGTPDEDVLSEQMQRFLLIKENYHDNIKNLEQLVAVDSKKNKAMKSLVKKNAAGSLLTVDSMQKLLRDKKDLLKVKKEFEERIVFEVERYDEQLRDIKNSIRLYQYYIERSYVRTPVSGIVRYVHYPQEGKFVSRGDSFAEIIEDAPSKFKIKLNVSAKDIGMIRVDTHVRMRLDTYDHAIFGFLSGTISSVSVDRLNEENDELYYRVEVIPDKNYLESNGQNFPLKYGMTLYGTIERGTVSLISYLMKPVIKHFHEIGHI